MLKQRIQILSITNHHNMWLQSVSITNSKVELRFSLLVTAKKSFNLDILPEELALQSSVITGVTVESFGTQLPIFWFKTLDSAIQARNWRQQRYLVGAEGLSTAQLCSHRIDLGFDRHRIYQRFDHELIDLLMNPLATSMSLKWARR
ncbi:hypothetical protein OK016_15215 [Vibrio chagasii]|nr:hypothetical protein [Vibrio chagasii]